jgi:tetratricopeptide (TPR) repeat protein
MEPRWGFARGDDGRRRHVRHRGGGGNAIGNVVTCNFGLSPERLQQLTKLLAAGGQTTFKSTEEVVAYVCGVAVGGDAKDNKINCNIGPQVFVEQIKDISGRLSINEQAVIGLLRIVGEDPNIPEDKLAEALTKAAVDYKRLQAKVAALNPDNPTAKRLVDEANSEIKDGRLQHAHDLLHQAAQTQIAAAQEARKLKDEAQTAEDTNMLGAARSTAAEADVSLTERDYLQAAALFDQAADDVPAGHPKDHGDYLLSEADALTQQGDERGDNDALLNAIEVSKRAFADFPRSQAPQDWASTQMALGNALDGLGVREPGTAQLEQAVTAYRAALEERTRERAPLDWAKTLSGLGEVLESLAEHESGTARLEEAVAAERAALMVLTPKQAELEWAMTQNNLGNALARLHQFDQAATAYRSALKVFTRERVPPEWASVEANLGNALSTLGMQESGTARLEQAVAAYRAALEELSPDRVPFGWAMATGNQGVALMVIADRTNNAAIATTAVQQIEAALETVTFKSHGPATAVFQKLLTAAEAVRDRLSGRRQLRNGALRRNSDR